MLLMPNGALLATAALFTILAANSQVSACPMQVIGGVLSVAQYGYTAFKAVEVKPGYKGCYKDNTEKHDFAIFGGRSEVNTILGCNSMCKLKKTRFFGVQNHDCWCGNVFGKYEKVDDDSCEIQCPGKPSETCGGFNLNAIYVVV